MLRGRLLVVEEDAGVASGIKVEGWRDGDSGKEGAALDIGEGNGTEEIDCGGEMKELADGKVK